MMTRNDFTCQTMFPFVASTFQLIQENSVTRAHQLNYPFRSLWETQISIISCQVKPTQGQPLKDACPGCVTNIKSMTITKREKWRNP
jgi:hypothetical protein